MERFGPKMKTHQTVGKICRACGQPFKEGDYTTLIVLGPGNDEEEMKKCRERRPYNGVAIEVHYSCATGIADV